MEKKPIGFWEEDEVWDLRRSEYVRIVAKTIENGNKAGFAEREIKRVKNDVEKMKEEEIRRWEAAEKKREESCKEAEDIRRKAEEIDNKRERELKKEIEDLKKKMEIQARIESLRMKKIVEWKEEIMGEVNFLQSLVERLTGLDLNKKTAGKKEVMGEGLKFLEDGEAEGDN